MLPSNDPFSEGLVYEASLPLHWSVIEGQGSENDAERVARNERNEDLLRILSVLDQGSVERGEDKQEYSLELLRLETKLNLVLELVGEMVSREIGLPENMPLKLSAKGLAWQTDNPPPKGTRVAVSLYLQPEIPRPLSAVGSIVGVEHNTVILQFEGMSEAVQNGLDKLIFRHHRRAIAQARHQDTSGHQ